jgi:hypothetical protein
MCATFQSPCRNGLHVTVFCPQGLNPVSLRMRGIRKHSHQDLSYINLDTCMISAALVMKQFKHSYCQCHPNDELSGIYRSWSLVWFQYLHLIISIKLGRGRGQRNGRTISVCHRPKKWNSREKAAYAAEMEKYAKMKIRNPLLILSKKNRNDGMSLCK